MKTFPGLILVTALGACGDNRPPTIEQPPPTPPAITGVNRVIHWDELDSSTVVGETPIDLYIDAEVPGEDQVRTANIADDGSFTIAGTPPQGTYWLRVVDGASTREDVYLLTDKTELDLGHDVVGDRATLATNTQTQVVINANGLAQWMDGDDGDVLIPGLAHLSAFQTYYATNAPIPGDTALDVNYAWFGQAVSTTPAGDDAYVVQVRQAHDDALGIDYGTPITALHTPPVALADGATSTVAGTLTAPPTLAVPVHWMRSAFAAQAASMYPGGCQGDIDFESYWVHALPGAGSHGELDGVLFDGIDNTPEFGPRVIDTFLSYDATDLVGSLTVQNPYPTKWLYAKYALDFEVQCPAPNGRSPGNAQVSIGVLTSDLSDAPVVPLVGPVGHPAIQGRDLTTLQVGVGPAPTVSWQAPVLGTPTSYELRLFEVVSFGLGGTNLQLHEDAHLIVPPTVTQITLPRDLLLDGVLYTIEIRAVSQGGQDVAHAPFRSGLPLGYADLLTGYFQL